MQAAWGHKWNSLFDDSDPDSRKIIEREWWDTIRDYTVIAIESAYQHAKRTMAWPPSLPEFTQLLDANDPVIQAVERNKRELEFNKRPEYLSGDSASPEFVREHLKKARRLLFKSH